MKSFSSKKGTVFIVSAPSGAGKTTIVERYLKLHPNTAQKSISCTTRPPRVGEVDGKDYFFITEEQFTHKLQQEAFLEHAEVFGYHYGTLKKSVSDVTQAGKDIFLVIDTQGALLLKNKLEAFFVFIMPPSIDALEQRLIHRKTEKASERDLRLSRAKDEMKKAEFYDKIIINDDLNQAYKEFEEFVSSKN